MRTERIAKGAGVDRGATANRFSLNGVLLVVLWASFAAAVVRELLRADEAVWGVTEWSINYEGGFVRRGLAGTLALFASRHIGVSALTLAVVASLLSLALLLWLAIRASRAGLLSWWAAPSASLLGGVAYGEFLIRKDTAVLAILAMCLWVLTRSIPLWLRLIGVSVLSLVGVLLHESYAVLVLPALTIIVVSLARRGSSAPSARSILPAAWLLPPWAAVVATIVNARPHAGVEVLWNSWFTSGASIGLPGASPDVVVGAVDALGWDAGKALSLSGMTLLAPQGVIWVAIAIGALLLTGAALDRRASPEHGTGLWPFSWRALLASQVILSGLLWVTGYDYSRWIVMTCTSVVLIWCWSVWPLRRDRDSHRPRTGRLRWISPWGFTAIALIFSTAGWGPWNLGTYLRGTPIVQIPILTSEVLDVPAEHLPGFFP